MFILLGRNVSAFLFLFVEAKKEAKVSDRKGGKTFAVNVTSSWVEKWLDIEKGSRSARSKKKKRDKEEKCFNKNTYLKPFGFIGKNPGKK